MVCGRAQSRAPSSPQGQAAGSPRGTADAEPGQAAGGQNSEQNTGGHPGTAPSRSPRCSWPSQRYSDKWIPCVEGPGHWSLSSPRRKTCPRHWGPPVSFTARG